MGPWAHDKGTNEKLSRTLQVMYQASEHITLQRMPPTPADAHAADPSLAHVAADSRRLLSPTPKSQTMF
jgi:hypothetical protein